MAARWWWNRGGNADSVGIDNNSSINTGLATTPLSSTPLLQVLQRTNALGHSR